MFACFCLLFLFFIERRFYGESTPFGKKSHRTAEIFGYLNSQQALADYAILIRSLKQNLSSEASHVVVFGGSYGGILGACSVVQAQSSTVSVFKVIKRSWEELDAVSNMKHGLPEWKQACTEMVMTISCSNESMFPPYENDFEAIEEQFMSRCGVKPRPHWITTEFGGKRIESVLKRFGRNIIFSNGMQDP
uniref:Peptidase S9 prolyl oligopeptidase catalytic domain-containing protein n=1 Tax=Brassica oleracea TaxID=3712 RepID=A0A3P6EAJ3_BRAOL|nr:unnamed protein product [Brassica oleracea]